MNQNNGMSNNGRPLGTPEDRKKYMDAWSKMMVDIWREKIERLQVWNTWKLHQEITEKPVYGNALDAASIMHSFMEYGIYQDMGVGREFEKKNGGDLGFHPVRQPRVWFSRAYYASIMVLKEHMSYMYGEEFCAIMGDVISSANYKKSKTLRSNA